MGLESIDVVLANVLVVEDVVVLLEEVVERMGSLNTVVTGVSKPESTGCIMVCELLSALVNDSSVISVLSRDDVTEVVMGSIAEVKVLLS